MLSVLREAPKGWRRARAHVALALEEAGLGVGEVDADGEHLGPGVAQARRLADPLRHGLHLLCRGFARVLEHRPSMVSHLEQPHRAVGNAPNQIPVVVLQNSRRNDAEAARDQRLARLLAVLQDRLLHGAAGLEGLRGVVPELLRQHQRELRLEKEVALAMRAEDEHRLEALPLVPFLAVVHMLHEKDLVDAQDGVVGHPTLRGAEVRRHEGLDIRPHLLSLRVLQRQVLPSVLP
mmetsp:Transcript_118479/g.331751  ORF Transcript_118479/g.331751 Transcript_118479/m.331751 type:complete len:235 (-) Transcript_118479:462-1166(-)